MKPFHLSAGQINRLIEPMGYCIASDRITVDGGKVGYIYREEGDEPADSGWRFLKAVRTKSILKIPAILNSTMSIPLRIITRR